MNKRISLDQLLLGRDPFQKYTRADYVLLAVALGVTILWVTWGLSYIPGFTGVEGWYIPTSLIVVSIAGCAYFWQLRKTTRLGWLAPLIITAVGASNYGYGLWAGENDILLAGLMALNCGIWSFIRLGVVHKIYRDQQKRDGVKS